MNAEERSEFIEYLRSRHGEIIFQHDAKELLMKAGLDEDLVHYLSKVIVDGTKIRVIAEVRRHIEGLVYFIKKL